jgi:hypothetical protein
LVNRWNENEEEPVIRLYDNDSGVEIGTLTDDQLQFLIDQLEEESTTDQDYYIEQATLDMFEGAGIDDGLLQILRGALGDRDGMEIRWQKEP